MRPIIGRSSGEICQSDGHMSVEFREEVAAADQIGRRQGRDDVHGVERHGAE